MGKFISIIDATALPKESVAHLTIDLIYQSGVYDPIADWLVSEHTPNDKSVDIAVGRGYFKKPTMTYHGYSDAVENVAIGANASGNPRIDAIVAYVDLGASPDATASNVLKFKAVAGTPASSPVAPDDTAIQASVGAGNPYILLANVAVADAFVSITDTEISDLRTFAYQKWLAGLYAQTLIKPYVKGSYQNVGVISGTGTKTLDCADTNVFHVTMTGDVTLALANISVGQFIQIDLIQDGSGGHTPTWFATIKWDDNVAPVQTPTASKSDSYVIKCIGTNLYRGYVVGQNQNA